MTKLGNSRPEKGYRGRDRIYFLLVFSPRSSLKTINQLITFVMSSLENPYKIEAGEESYPVVDDKIEEENLEIKFEDYKEIKIPPKVCERMLSRMLKKIDKGHIPEIDEILNGMGLTGEEAFYRKLYSETDLFLNLGRIANSERERAIEEQRKLVDLERKCGRLKKTTGPFENFRDWEIEENEKDAAYIGQVKEFIKNNEGNLKEIELFWKVFDTLIKDRKEAGECRDSFHGSNQIKNGIISELAAERLLLGFEDYLKNNKAFQVMQSKSEQDSPIQNNDQSTVNKNPEAISFSIEKSTPKQDVREQTDFFLIMHIGKEEKKIPVQVKSIFFSGKESGDERLGDLKLAEEHPCSFSLPQPGSENSHFWLKMERFYSHHEIGLFIILPHDASEFKISDMGFASEKLKDFFYEKLKKEMESSLI
jgi:hypothetical protein